MTRAESPDRWDVACLGVLLVAVYAVKHLYSSASAEDLALVLVPTTTLVEWLTGVAFVAERGAGFISQEHGFVIAPVCAGVNFLLVSVLALGFGFIRRHASPRRKALWVLVAALLAYGGTLLANAARISLALGLHRQGGWLASPQVHRVEGTAVYLLCLVALYVAVERAHTQRGPVGLRVPLACYLGVTLLVPALNGAPLRGAFAGHAAVVLVVTGLVALAACVPALLRRGIGLRGETG